MGNKRAEKESVKITILLIPLLLFLLFFALRASCDLITTSYKRDGVIIGTLSIPKAIYCKWNGPSAKAESACMGWQDTLP